MDLGAISCFITRGLRLEVPTQLHIQRHALFNRLIPRIRCDALAQLLLVHSRLILEIIQLVLFFQAQRLQGFGLHRPTVRTFHHTIAQFYKLLSLLWRLKRVAFLHRIPGLLDGLTTCFVFLELRLALSELILKLLLALVLNES